jgi:curved DNA-binding protein CbpA
VTSNADQEVIRAAYRALAKKYHPDTASAASPVTNAKFREISEAHSVLSDPRSRAEYDRTLAPEPIDPSRPSEPSAEEAATPRTSVQSGIVAKTQYGAAALLVFGVGGAIVLLIVLMIVASIIGAQKH